MRAGLTNIRPYERTDAGALAALFHAAARSTAPRDYTAEQVAAWSPRVGSAPAWAARCESKETWVATIGDQIAGFTDLERDGHIDMLFVHPAHQRQGVASALLGYVEREARSRNFPRLYAEASITARPVFERMEFRVIAGQTVVIRGVALNNFRVEKPLTPSR